MRGNTIGGFLVGAALAAAAGAACVVPWTSRPVWAAAGFAATALPGLAAGAFLAREHGRPGPGFVVAFGAGLAGRLVLVLAAAAGAAGAGVGARSAVIAGLAAGFLPVTTFEIAWLTRAGAAAGRREARG